MQRIFYPKLVDDAILHLEPFGGLLNKVAGNSYGLAKDTAWEINRPAATILTLCDGKITFSEILQKINHKYISSDFDIVESSAKYIQESIANGVLDLYDCPDTKSSCRISGSFDCYSPIHISVELTDGCNMKCLHCYRKASFGKGKFLEVKELLLILEQAAKNGVYTIELTGGEPTMHPDFSEIMTRCASLYKMVCILSNGFSFNRNLVNKISEFNNIFVQIDLDGDTDKLHDYLRGINGSFNKAVQAVRMLKDASIFVRVVNNVHPGNLHAVESTARLAKSLGVNSFGIAPILDIGRGKYMETLSIDQLAELGELQDRLRHSYPSGFIHFPDKKKKGIYDIKGNCGAGSKSVVISPSGDVRICLMMEDGKGVLCNVKNWLFGNLFENELTGYLYDLDGPHSKWCKNCRFQTFCAGCIVRPLFAMQYMKENDLPVKCYWDEEKQFTQNLNIEIPQ